MGTITGSLDGVHNVLTFGTPVSLGVSCPANYYPNGSITFDGIHDGGAYWKNTILNASKSITLYLCDSAGNNRVQLFTVTLSASGSNTTKNSATISGATGLTGKALYLIATGDTSDIRLNRSTSVTINTQSASYAITLVQSNHGTIAVNKSTAAPGTTIKITATPATGYELSGYTTSPSVTITNNKFTMPSHNVQITGVFTEKTYTVTTQVNPSGAGTVTASPSSATQGTQITLSTSPPIGYYFNGWSTSPAVAITGGKFQMPASNVTVTANYLLRSTATLDSSTLTGGGTASLNIQAEKSTYKHSYQLSFGTGMETEEIDVAAGVTNVQIAVPAAWAEEISNAATKSGGSLTLKTYKSNGVMIGFYHINNLTYAVPADAVPEIGTIVTEVARTIGGTTYANIGDIYTQNKCGVRIQADAESVYQATVESMTVSVSGYAGAAYSTTVQDDEVDFTTGLLTNSGATTITVTATDSRGRTSSRTATITVTGYSAPFGTLEVKRADSMGAEDPLGQYAIYTLSKSYSAIGSNTLTAGMTANGYTASVSNDTGDVLPGNRQSFAVQQEYTVTVTLQDAFETVQVTAKLPSAKFIIHASGDGSHLSFMKASTHSTPSGKTSTIEFSADSQIYIGNDTLEDYIRAIVNSMNS